MFKSSNLKRSLSSPNLNVNKSTAELEAFKSRNYSNNNLSESQFKKLVQTLVNESKSSNSHGQSSDSVDTIAIACSLNLRDSQKQFEAIKRNHLLNDLASGNSSSSDNQRSNEANLSDYFSRLNAIHAGFINLKANPKYLKQIFGDSLLEAFRSNSNDESKTKSVQENIHFIFSGLDINLKS